MTKNPEQISVSPETRKKETVSINASEIGDVSAARRVCEAFHDAERLANPQEETSTDTKMYQDMVAYGERNSISQECIKNVAQETGVEESLAALDREETAARNRFSDRLRRISAQVAACISLMTPNMDAIAGPVQEPVAQSQPAEPIERSQTEKPSRTDGSTQAEAEKPDTRVLQNMEMTDEEWDQYVAREEQRQARLLFEKEFRERRFADEKELLQSLHDAALNHENEFVTIYTVSGGDEVEVILGEFADKDSAVITNTAQQMRALRQEGKKVVMAHTHIRLRFRRRLLPNYCWTVHSRCCRRVFRIFVPPRIWIGWTGMMMRAIGAI